MLPSFLGIVAQGSGGGCPAAGTIISWEYGVTYPIAQGGEYVTLNVDGTDGDYPIENCDVPIKADGSCGTYYDWASVTNVGYKPVGTLIAEDSIGYDRNNMQSVDIYVNCGQVGSFTPGTNHYKYESNGSGGTNTVQVGDYYVYGSAQGLSNPYDVWTSCEDPTTMSVNLFWDGSGNLIY